MGLRFYQREFVITTNEQYPQDVKLELKTRQIYLMD